jgi:hypothetical protein
MQNHGPGYPSFSLKLALEKAAQLHSLLGHIDITVKESLNCWGYGPRSLVGQRIISTLTSFGLVEILGSNAERRLIISDLAHNNLFSDNSSLREKSRAMQQVALNPDLYQILWGKWGYELPMDYEVEQYLVQVHDFNQKNATQFLRDYYSTIELAREYGLVDFINPYDKDDTDLDFEDHVEVETEGLRPLASTDQDDTDLNL